MADLFSPVLENGAHRPLADRMRPRNLDEFTGQNHILGPGKLLRRAIEADLLGSIILYGPPGSGKTTLAHIVSRTTTATFRTVSAVSSGVKELRQIIEEAADHLKYHGKKTILFVDECHAFNKSQQDVLLPAIEKGIVTFIGGTTENPYFEMRGALLSRSRVFQLEELSPADLREILERALSDRERGLGDYRTEVEPEALAHLVDMANGDARNALNALELAVVSTPPGTDRIRRLTLTTAQESIQRRAVRYDRSGDQHYDVISAFIKSIRGSDPDAALHWYARMTCAGEDQRFIVRRLIILASEDIGLADPRAMLIAHAAWNALETVGMPEARIPIAQCIVYLALAPKSNSVYQAIGAAMDDVQKTLPGPVPAHLRDTHYPGAEKLGHNGYLYPHDYPGHYVSQQYLPGNLKGRRYYRPSGQGFEKKKT
jgi:putative ATPase